MIRSVRNYPISQLFDQESNVVYSIPRYQREYTWYQNQWETLFDDIQKNDAGYFLGSIICINQSEDTLDPVQSLEVVDGQQRLTTLSLLFAAVYKTLKQREGEMDDDQRLELINLKRKLVLKKGNHQMRVVPQVQSHNQDDYRAILSEAGVMEAFGAPNYAPLRKIFRAFKYFRERLDGLIEDGGNGIEPVISFLEKISQASLVKIEVGSHTDAYILFESLNNRGMPLTAVDLVKNKLLARLERMEPGRIDHYFGQWNDLLKYLGDDYKIQERFFRQYYNAFREELKSIHNVPLATRSNLMQIFEKLVDNDAKLFLEKILAAGKIYARFLSRNQEETVTELEKPFKDLERIQGSPAYLLLLYLMVHRERLGLTHGDVAEITKLLVRFFVRRNLTDLPPTRDLTRLFMNIIEKLPELKGGQVIDAVFENLKAVSSSDEEFEKKLFGPIYDENSGVARFVLCALAEEGMTKETFVDLWQMENRQFAWTIEHIFPQGSNIPQSWVDMIAGGDENKAKYHQEVFVHNLGNLTITRFNSTLSNKSFPEKRDRRDKQGRYIGYRNGLKLNEGLANAETWTVNEIHARSEKLVAEVLELFKLDRA